MGGSLDWISHILHICRRPDRLVESLHSSTDKHSTMPPAYSDLPWRPLVALPDSVGGGLGLVRLRLPFCPQPRPGVSILLFLSPHALLCPSLSCKAVPCSLRFFQSHFLHAQTWSQSPVVGSCRTVLSGMAVSFSICLTICFSLSPVIVWALRGGFRLVCH